MRRFLITNPKVFNGEAEVVYDGIGKLVKIDFSNTDMTVNMVTKFKEHIPANFEHLEGMMKHSIATIVETTMRIDFEQWWREYDKKINKKRCTPLFEKLTDSDTVLALLGIKPYKKYLKSLPYARPMADPEKYLKDRYWENEWK